MNKIYSINHFNFIDKIIVSKRQEMCDVINQELNNENFIDALDIGSTNDVENESSNYLIKNLKNVSNYKCISDQKIDDIFFSKTLNKSITEEFSKDQVQSMKSDIVISNATIEHVGSIDKQKKMIENILLLTKKYFIITTPNRYHPIDFHTKLPLIHWLPKNIHRKILKMFKLNFFSEEENLNLLSKNELKNLLIQAGANNFTIFDISLLGFKSNYIVIGLANQDS